MKKKNVVYFLFDELRCDALGCYGNPAGQMQTPHIDEIAAAGTRFTRCYCNSPVCVPSRMSCITGLYPEDTGVYGNEASLPPFALNRVYDTIPDVFERNGYQTASFGKGHLPWDMRTFQIHNMEGSEMDFGLGKDFGKLEKITAKGEIRQNLGSIFPEDRCYKPEKVAQNSIAWLKEHKKEPFFLRISFLQPHTPVLVKQEFADIYKNLNFSGKWKKKENASEYEKAFAELLASDTLSSEDLIRMKQLYYALVAWTDTQVGLVTDYLREHGLLENTILVVSTDHGCNLGESGAYAKFLFSPHSQNVPLIISAPGKEAAVNEHICSNLDLASTLFGLTQIPKPEQFRGRDLFASDEKITEYGGVHDNKYDGNELAVYGTIGYGEDCSYAMQYDAAGHRGWPRRACIRTDRFRLDMNVRQNGQAVDAENEDIFFTDSLRYPEEDVNLADKEEYAAVIENLRERLLAHCNGSKECPREVLHEIEESLISKKFFVYLEQAKSRCQKLQAES